MKQSTNLIRIKSGFELDSHAPLFSNHDAKVVGFLECHKCFKAVYVKFPSFIDLSQLFVCEHKTY